MPTEKTTGVSVGNVVRFVIKGSVVCTKVGEPVMLPVNEFEDGVLVVAVVWTVVGAKVLL